MDCKIVTIVGARPQFVKAAVVSRALAAADRAAGGGRVREEIVHTGQHYDPGLSQVFFDEMEIPQPEVNLEVGSGSHGETTGAMLAGVERELQRRRPDWVLVYGDTNSTLAGALAAAKLHLPVAHVEAGLRSFNRRMPEEINRVLTDHVSARLFCPTPVAQRHLANEGISAGVEIVGDVMYDAALHYRRRALPPREAGPFLLATIHRAENTDDPQRLGEIFAGLAAAPLPVLLPLHPRTAALAKARGLKPEGRLRLREPASYFEMLGLLQACAGVLTDSGGLQKEAYFFGKRCVTVRDETEWTELVEAGVNRLCRADSAAIPAAAAWAAEPGLPTAAPLYGAGDAGEKIVASLLQHPA